MVVNGAVLRSVGRTNICVESKATILRGRDVMTVEEANTPARLLYFRPAMMALYRSRTTPPIAIPWSSAWAG